jgi:hypothetical protein
LELGAEYVRERNRDKLYFLQFVPIYGVTYRLELSAELPYKFSEIKEGEDIRGLEDVILALKALAVKEGDNSPALLLKIVIKFESGN